MYCERVVSELLLGSLAAWLQHLVVLDSKLAASGEKAAREDDV